MFTTVSQEVENKFGNVATCNRDVLDRRTNDITIGDGNSVCVTKIPCSASDVKDGFCLVRPEDSRVTPSPLSITTPVRVLSATLLLDQEAASAKTA